MLIINFEGREAKGLSKDRYDETFAGEDVILCAYINVTLLDNDSRSNWAKKDHKTCTIYALFCSLYHSSPGSWFQFE